MHKHASSYTNNKEKQDNQQIQLVHLLLVSVCKTDKHDVSAAAVVKQDLVVCWDENLERTRGI